VSVAYNLLTEAVVRGFSDWCCSLWNIPGIKHAGNSTLVSHWTPVGDLQLTQVDLWGSPDNPGRSKPEIPLGDHRQTRYIFGDHQLIQVDLWGPPVNPGRSKPERPLEDHRQTRYIFGDHQLTQVDVSQRDLWGITGQPGRSLGTTS